MSPSVECKYKLDAVLVAELYCRNCRLTARLCVTLCSRRVGCVWSDINLFQWPVHYNQRPTVITAESWVHRISFWLHQWNGNNWNGITMYTFRPEASSPARSFPGNNLSFDHLRIQFTFLHYLWGNANNTGLHWSVIFQNEQSRRPMPSGGEATTEIRNNALYGDTLWPIDPRSTNWRRWGVLRPVFAADRLRWFCLLTYCPKLGCLLYSKGCDIFGRYWPRKSF